MRGRRRTYGITIFILSLFLVCFLIDVKLRPPTTSYYPQFQVTTVNETGLGVSENVQAIRFYNLLNTTLTQTIDTIRVEAARPPPTTPRPDIRDNSTRANGELTTSGTSASNNNNNIRSRAHFIAIVSYMRSGSTLTADIMQHFPGAFYIFEPFHSVVVRTRRGQSLFYTNGTSRRLTSADLTDDFFRAELRKWMECRFDDLDVSSLADNFHQHFSRSMRKFALCWHQKPRIMKSLRQCIPVAKALCENAQYRLFKFIRLPMRIVKSVFPMYPNFQIVHLLRDPRGVMMSQMKVKKFQPEQLPEWSRDHCASVADDLKYSTALHKQYPKRVKILLYEHLAENPLAIATNMYHYTNMPIYDYITKYVSDITKKGRKGGSEHEAFGVLKVNSTLTAYSWRDKIGFTNVQTIDSNCHEVYDFLGYQSFSSTSDVLNHALSTLIAPQTSLII